MSAIGNARERKGVRTSSIMRSEHGAPAVKVGLTCSRNRKWRKLQRAITRRVVAVTAVLVYQHKVPAYTPPNQTHGTRLIKCCNRMHTLRRDERSKATHQPTDLPTHSGPTGATQPVIRNLTRTTGRTIGCMGLAEGELPSDDAIRITSVAPRCQRNTGL
uniref:Uncharacterized protein n=1 Tax=Anopheles culicifacies TaxID=139723 RepID=A0A182M9Q6_9DIPT